MYRNCIFCSAGLGANDAVERFPVGRTLAFDEAKGRLWAVCGRCSRWNLAPLEERWEAIEDAERLFRDTRLRVQSENIGLARLGDGTRLIRVGQALQGEVAAWRYGREMKRRRNRDRATTAAGIAVPIGMVAGALAAVPFAATFAPLLVFAGAWREVALQRGAQRVAYRVPAADSPTGMSLTVRWRDLRLASTALGDDGRLELRLVQTAEEWRLRNPLTLRGSTAAALLGKALVHINGAGAQDDVLGVALDEIAKVGGAEPFLRREAAVGHGLERPGLMYGNLLPTFTPELPARARENAAKRPAPLHARTTVGLALEIALHEETERRAMDGELAALRSMWREAEQIADIADRLPDVPRSDPPRLGA